MYSFILQLQNIAFIYILHKLKIIQLLKNNIITILIPHTKLLKGTQNPRSMNSNIFQLSKEKII